MKKLLLGLTLLTSFSAFSYELFTNDYFVIFNEDYSNSKGKDTTCSITTVKQHNNTLIRVRPVGTGRLVQLAVPNNKLPLKDGDNFIIKSTTGDMRLKYNQKVLSISINDIKDEKSIGHLKDVGTLEIDPDLTNPKFVFVSVLKPKKNTFRKIITRTLVSLRCTF